MPNTELWNISQRKLRRSPRTDSPSALFPPRFRNKGDFPMPSRPVALEDLFRFRLAGDTQISPHGSRVVFTVKRIDEEKNKYYTSLWMGRAGAGGEGESQPFTGDGHADAEPRWSPDGRQIAFVSD